MPIISIEGSIGAGKTTFLKAVEAAGYKVMYEPVDKWSEEMINGKSMFEMYYKDKQKYGFAFQMLVLQSQVQEMIEYIRAHPRDIIICERSILTNFKVFAQLMYEEGTIDDYSFRVYKMWYEFATSLLPPISGILYLRVSPETCVQRIIKRNRKGEEMININYLKALNEKHDSWLFDNDGRAPPMHVVDGNGSVPPVSVLTDFLTSLGI